MHRTTRLFIILAALHLLPLAGCAPLSQPLDENRAVIEKMRALQEQLQLVQEKLARLQAEEALTQGRKPETPAAWTALTAAGSEPTGFGRYSYLLFRDRQRFSALLPILDALPARSDLPQAETNRFLLPLKNSAGGESPSWNDYDAELTSELLRPLGDAAADIKGPLLVVADRPLGEESAPLVIDLAGAADDLATEILTHCQSRVAVTSEDNGPIQAPFFWTLLEQTAPRPATVTRSGAVLLLSWRP